MLVFHSKVYISLFFCVLLEKCFWYSLCVDCLQAPCCQRSLSKGTEMKWRHWTYAKWKEFVFIAVTWLIEQRTTSLCCRRYAVLVFVVQASVDCNEEEKSEEEKKMGIQSENHVSSKQEVPHYEMLRVPYSLCL